MPDFHKGKHFLVENTVINPLDVTTDNALGMLVYSDYRDGSSQKNIDSLCANYALVKFHFKDSTVHFFEKYDDIFCKGKIKNPFVQFKLRLINDDNIIVVSPFKLEFRIYNQSEMEIKTFDFEEFDEHKFYLNNPIKEIWENDYFISLTYNSIKHQYYLMMFEGGDYLEPDDFIAEPIQNRKFTLLVFNEAFNLEGKINFGDTFSNTYFGTVYPSPNGFFLQKNTKNKYEIQEFIIQN
ncbi:MAG: hypothetical protein ACPG6V_06905 [Flavobacteriales bacterium]